MQPATSVVADIVAAIEPWDDREKQHIAEALDWLRSTDDIFRRIAPGTPSPHLVVYTVLVDRSGRGLYLGRHRKSGLDLPMGGHVDPGEHPVVAARREATEELGIEADFGVFGERPFFLTVTTVGHGEKHVDISLWHIISGDRDHLYPLDPGEFEGGRWWDLDPAALPDSDPHMSRFIAKLDAYLSPELPR